MGSMGKTALAWLIKGAAWIARFEIWPVGVGVLLATASAGLAPWGLATLALVVGARWLAQGRPTARTPVDWPAAGLLGMGGVSWLVTADRAATFIAVSRLLAGLSLMYSVGHWAGTRARRALLAQGMTLGALLLALATPLVIPWEQLGDAALYARVPHLWDAPLNPNMVAGALVMLLPFPLAAFLLSPAALSACLPWPRLLSRRVWRGVNGFTILLLMGALALTQSRGGWLAAGAAVFVVGLGYTRHFLWALLAPGMVVGWLLARGQMQPFLDALGTGGVIAGWAERVEIWSRALYIIQDFPFTGAGANTYPLIVNLLYPMFLVAPDRLIPHAHNLYLQVTVDLGVPGLIAFVAIVLIALFCAARGMRRSATDPAGNVIAWAGCASLAAMLVHGLVDATPWIVGWGAPLPWLVIGLLLATEMHVTDKLVA